MSVLFLPPLSRIEFASPYAVGLISETLATAKIPCVAYGIAALQCYGVELCIIVSSIFQRTLPSPNLNLKDVEIVVRDADVGRACAELVKSGLSVVADPPGPSRSDYGRKDLLYLEPPSSAAAAWNDFSQKVYIVIYRESAVRLDVVADADERPQVADVPHYYHLKEGDTASGPELKYQIPSMKALHVSFLHGFLVSTYVEQEARMEMLLAYLHRELKKDSSEESDVPEEMKPCLALVLGGRGGWSEREEVKKRYRQLGLGDKLFWPCEKRY